MQNTKNTTIQTHIFNYLYEAAIYNGKKISKPLLGEYANLIGETLIHLYENKYPQYLTQDHIEKVIGLYKNGSYKTDKIIPRNIISLFEKARINDQNQAESKRINDELLKSDPKGSFKAKAVLEVHILRTEYKYSVDENDLSKIVELIEKGVSIKEHFAKTQPTGDLQ